MSARVCRLLLFVNVSVHCFQFRDDSEDECALTVSGENLRCVPLLECEGAKKLLHENETPRNCGFNGNEPKVCCSGYPEERTKEPGDLARDACEKMKQRMEMEFLHDPPVALIVSGGVEAKRMEFKHMAVIGFDEEDKKRWLCGGSLISDQYILTAAHCLHAREIGAVRYIRLGDLDYTTDDDGSNYQDFNVSEIIKHPNYTFPSTYNDIALLKLDRPANLDKFVRPACLHFINEIDPSRGELVVAGWGKTEAFADEGSSHLRKADVELFSHDSCSKVYSKDYRKLDKGIVEELQVCAGSHVDESNTCEGDSGGPLEQDLEWYGDTLSTIIGVTSFGKAFGFPGVPGVYTRVSGYIGWIENVVWKAGD